MVTSRSPGPGRSRARRGTDIPGEWGRSSRSVRGPLAPPPRPRAVCGGRGCGTRPDFALLPLDPRPRGFGGERGLPTRRTLRLASGLVSRGRPPVPAQRGRGWPAPPRRASERAAFGLPWCPWSAPGRLSGARGRAGAVVPRSQRPPHAPSSGRRRGRAPEERGKEAIESATEGAPRPPPPQRAALRGRGGTGDSVAPPRAPRWGTRMGLGARPRDPLLGVPAGARERSWRAESATPVAGRPPLARAGCRRSFVPPPVRVRVTRVGPVVATPRRASRRRGRARGGTDPAGPDRERSPCPVPTRAAGRPRSSAPGASARGPPGRGSRRALFRGATRPR